MSKPTPASTPSCGEGNSVRGDLAPVTVSVIMPIRNEGSFIARSLRAVLTQDYPHKYLEVLIADGMSDDSTRDIIAALSAGYPQVRLQTIDNPERIVPTGFNAALNRSTGAIIVRVDGHTVVAPDYVQQCVYALHRTGADNVGGRMVAAGETAFARAVALATSSRFGVGGAQFHYLDSEAWTDTVYMGAWPRQVFERVGLFDEEQVRNQDDEFNYRLREQGGRILLSPMIRSTYYNRARPRSLFKQYYQYGYWKVRVMQKHPAQMRVYQFLPPLFVAALVVNAAILPFMPIGRWSLGLIIAAYIAGNVSATALNVERDRWRLAPNVALAFCLIHFGYGIGFLSGLIKFRKRWSDRGILKFPSAV